MSLRLAGGNVPGLVIAAQGGEGAGQEARQIAVLRIVLLGGGELAGRLLRFAAAQQPQARAQMAFGGIVAGQQGVYSLLAGDRREATGGPGVLAALEGLHGGLEAQLGAAIAMQSVRLAEFLVVSTVHTFNIGCPRRGLERGGAAAHRFHRLPDWWDA